MAIYSKIFKAGFLSMNTLLVMTIIFVIVTALVTIFSVLTTSNFKKANCTGRAVYIIGAYAFMAAGLLVGNFLMMAGTQLFDLRPITYVAIFGGIAVLWIMEGFTASKRSITMRIQHEEIIRENPELRTE